MKLVRVFVYIGGNYNIRHLYLVSSELDEEGFESEPEIWIGQGKSYKKTAWRFRRVASDGSEGYTK